MLDWRHRLCIVSRSCNHENHSDIHDEACRAQEFAKQGCTVYATSRRVETIADFANPRIYKLALDVTSDENVQNVIQEIIRKEGKIDVVVNNAGVICPGRTRS